MKKVLENIRYKMGYQSIWAAWYVVCYAITMFFLYFGLIRASVLDSYSGGLSYRLWGIVLFQFAVTMKFKEDFDLFLILSNTRTEIFWSLVGTAVAFSAIFSGFIVLERILFDALNKLLGFQGKDFFHHFAAYSTGNIPLQFFFFFTLCLCCSALGLLLGSLFYRFGKRFTFLFWLIFSAIPVLLLPLFLGALSRGNHLSDALRGIVLALQGFDVGAVSLSILLLAAILTAAAYGNIRKLSQR